MHDCTDVFAELWVDGQNTLGDVLQVFHHQLISEIIREQFRPFTEENNNFKYQQLQNS